MYTYVLELRFVYFYTIYKRIISEQHEWDTFTTLTILG